MNSKQIEFYFNRELITLNLSTLDFNTTISEFINQREACTPNSDQNSFRTSRSACVILGEDGGRGKLEYQLVDATLLTLPILHGKQVITYSGISEFPAIQRIQEVLKNGVTSCEIAVTEDLVLALFIQYTHNMRTAIEDVKEIIPQKICLSNNYEKICALIVAIFNQKESDKTPDFEIQKTEIYDTLWSINNHKEQKAWQREEVTLYRANSLVNALQLLSKHPEAQVIHGTKNHHLGEKEAFRTSDVIIDISAVSELEICVEDHSWQLFGTGMKIEELYQFSEKRIPEFAKILSNFGPFLVRNTLTIGSCLSAETSLRKLAPFLMVSQAELLFKTLEKNRIVPLNQFISLPPNQRTEPSELLALLKIPKRKRGELFYAKESSTQRNTDPITLSIAACIEIKNNTIEAIEIVFGTSSHTPKYAFYCMEILKGNPFTFEQFAKAIGSVQADLQSTFSNKTELDLVTPLAEKLLQSCYSEFEKK